MWIEGSKGQEIECSFGKLLAVNTCLMIILIIGYLKMNVVHEELFYSEVQSKLV